MRNLLAKLQSALVTKPSASKDEAKQRLKLLLIHDQVDLPQAQLDAMREEILDVIKRYCEVDQAESIEFKLNREDGHVALVSTIPVRRVTASVARA